MSTNKEEIERIIKDMPVAASLCDEHNNCTPDSVYIKDVRKALTSLTEAHKVELEANSIRVREEEANAYNKIIESIEQKHKVEMEKMVEEILEIVPEHQGGRLKLWSDIKAIAKKFDVNCSI